jgi:hypothetical protein
VRNGELRYSAGDAAPGAPNIRMRTKIAARIARQTTRCEAQPISTRSDSRLELL